MHCPHPVAENENHIVSKVAVRSPPAAAPPPPPPPPFCIYKLICITSSPTLLISFPASMQMENAAAATAAAASMINIPAADAHNSSNGALLSSTSSGALSILASFHAGYFRISLSLSGQALLWKTLISPPSPSSSSSPSSNHLLRRLTQMLPSTAFVLLWSVALATLVALSLLYTIRCVLRFSSVKAEFKHHIGVNYLFAPWISSLLLLQSSPFAATTTTSYRHALVLWLAVSVIPVLALDVKIYGQWFTQAGKGRRFLSVVANPTSQMSVIGNLVGAKAAAELGWRESAICMFSLGIAHYLVLFVTLYQRLAGSDRLLPVMLRPVFFLFFAAPSMASVAWDSISGTFDVPSKMLFFLSLFLFASLVSRPTLFRRSMRRFNVAWWAYSFPLTMLALASSEYAQEVKGGVANALMIVLFVISVTVSLVLLVYTALNTAAILPHDDPFMVPLPTTVPSDAVSTNDSAGGADGDNANDSAGGTNGDNANCNSDDSGARGQDSV